MKHFIKQIIVAVLTWEARMVLARYKPKVVGVTGSVGKTSTKDAIYSALADHFFVRKSEKSFNSDIGVPLTVLGLPNGWSNVFVWIENMIRGLWIAIVPQKYPEWLVLEVGADRPGDIEKVTRWLKVDVVVVTRIGSVPVHVEFFKSQKELVREKSFLAQALKDGGTLVLNADDEDVLAFKKYAKGKVITVSLEGEGDLVASHRDIYYEKNEAGEEEPRGMTFRINFSGNSVPVVRKGALGLQHVFPTLYAVAVSVALGLNIVPASESLSREVQTPGRMRLLPGVKNTFVIDDTYNSSPIALLEAIKTLGLIQVKGRKIAALGDMLELGKHSTEEHQKAGQAVAKVADILVTVGVRSRDIVQGALGAGMNELNIMQFDYSREAGKWIEMNLKPGDLVLVKGSQSMRMEKVVEEIMAEPERKEELLARQDTEWTKR